MLKIYLSSNEINELQKFFDKVKDRDTNEIHFALSKYIESYNRKSPSDMILDLVITLEILLGKSDDIDSIKYRICNRLINCLSRDIKERDILYSRTSKLYNTRSRIVHGSIRRLEHRKDFESCVRNMEYYKEIIRLIFKTFMEWINIGLNHESIVRRLDLNVQDIVEADFHNAQWYE